MDEHASIPSFLRFGLELVHLGAPPEMISRASSAAMDEVRHAQIATQMARRIDGQSQGPGALDCADVSARTDWAQIAAACVHEGCVGETIAAAQLAVAARTAPAEIATTLRSMSDDEEQHAALAWRFIAWSWKSGGAEVQRAIRTAFTHATEGPVAGDPRETLLAGVPSEARRNAGRLTAGESAAIAASTLRQVIRPCADALMVG
jgi:hypothetical protein